MPTKAEIQAQLKHIRRTIKQLERIVEHECPTCKGRGWYSLERNQGGTAICLCRMSTKALEDERAKERMDSR